MREAENKKIDGCNYVCAMMPATKAQKTFVEVSQRIGSPAMAMLSRAFSPSVEESGKITGGLDTTVEGLVAEGLRIFLLELDPDTADRIIKTVMDGVLVEGDGKLTDEAVFDQHFRGRVLSMYRVFAWAMEVNYRDFSDAASLNSLVPKLRAAGRTALDGLMSTQLSEEPSSETAEKSTSEA